MGKKARDTEDDKSTKPRKDKTRIRDFHRNPRLPAGRRLDLGSNQLILQGGGTPGSSPFLSLNSIWKMIPGGANSRSQEARIYGVQTESSQSTEYPTHTKSGAKRTMALLDTE